jgi:hypothetical protein
MLLLSQKFDKSNIRETSKDQQSRDTCLESVLVPGDNRSEYRQRDASESESETALSTDQLQLVLPGTSQTICLGLFIAGYFIFSVTM